MVFLCVFQDERCGICGESKSLTAKANNEAAQTAAGGSRMDAKRFCAAFAVLLSVLALPTLTVAQTPAASGASASAERLMARPSWATAERLRGRDAAATPVTIQVHLPLQNLEAAKAELEAVSDPDSPRYGQYLSSEEFEAKY